MITDVDTSSVALAVANVCSHKRRLMLNVGAATTALTNANCNNYTFHYAYDTYVLANGTGTEVTKTIGKNWYIIYPNYAFGQDMNRSFTSAIEEARGKVLLADLTSFPNDDFSTYLMLPPPQRRSRAPAGHSPRRERERASALHDSASTSWGMLSWRPASVMRMNRAFSRNSCSVVAPQ